ncbi:hypothetical protein [Aquisphaera insulae]|uniref:hypothetical protein n=1 Tax=Aquisphaera insulae TaxID=2712864 RepID=UPI0013EC2EB5|nr:hypothetical protein [Aquisphaera insulae]
MKDGASFAERFEGWFARPIAKLAELPEGDGAFLALSASLFLCERYYRTVTNTHEGIGGDEAFKVAAANDFGMHGDEFKRFWKVYRHGIQHQGMPKLIIDNGVTYKWKIDDSYDAVTSIDVIDANNRVIKLNPWKFADLMLNKFRSDPAILSNATLHAFAEILSS